MERKRCFGIIARAIEKKVKIRELSKQIQMVNDSGALFLNADFQKSAGQYKVLVTVVENKSESVVLSTNNSGNKYTGDWRLTTTYVNSNLSNHSDYLGVAAVTSPGHWDDVKQAALSYRFLLPKNNANMYFTYSYSDVDMGTIANFSGLSMAATGKGQTVGLHYQQNLVYTAKNKEVIDFGIDHKRYENQQNYSYSGGVILNDGMDFNVTTFSTNYINTHRTNKSVFSYNVGYTTNMNGDKTTYSSYRYGSDTHYNLWQTGFIYQYLTPSKWILSLRMNGQYTKNNLLTTEQLGAGGANSVRGFGERSISADNGYVGSLEFYTPEFAKNQRFVLFTDFARLFNNHANSGEIDGDEIASSGIGYRYTNEKTGFVASIDYAKIINGLDNMTDQNAKKWQVTLGQKF